MKSNDIDVVIYWVDGDDKEWLSEYSKYKKKPPNRFRDLDIMKFIFRGIEKFMPWIRNVHFITCGHTPSWLNIKNEKLKLHTHKDIFYFQDALPVFNSSAIEANFANIPNLSEKFILFNDDMLILKPISVERFFIHDKPVDYISLSYKRKGFFYEYFKPQNANACKFINNAYNYIDNKKTKNIKFSNRINKNYTLKTNLNNLLFSLFSDIMWFNIYHHPQAHLKSTWLTFSEKEKNTIIKETSFSKFRSSTDINQYLYRFINLSSNNFYPKEYTDHLSVYVKNIKKLQKNIDNYLSYTFLCICEDENMSNHDFNFLKKILNENLTSIFPIKSNFEI
ncbi:stealth family protein [Morganella morganii]|uniref:stealth family protein n=1 Tax=Morganella morganii TaxID=582 RepID=UPI0006664E91|nr:stealth family protein [Morganella morganii]